MGGGSYYEHIEIENGDFVNGNKEFKGGDGSIFGENIKADTIKMNNAEPTSVADLMQVLAQFHAIVKELPLEKDEAEVIEGEFVFVEDQLGKEEPKKHLILPKLKTILEVVSAAGAASEALPKVIEMGEQVLTWVDKVL